MFDNEIVLVVLNRLGAGFVVYFLVALYVKSILMQTYFLPPWSLHFKTVICIPPQDPLTTIAIRLNDFKTIKGEAPVVCGAMSFTDLWPVSPVSKKEMIQIILKCTVINRRSIGNQKKEK